MIDLLILGAGPAGMAAAIEASRLGLSVQLLDENAAPGGQVHRNARADARGPGDIQAHAGAKLMAELAASGADCVYGATLWAIEPGPTAFYSVNGAARRVEAKRIILAPGATERALPIPGWTLPGVMGVGAAQTLLKSAGLVPQGEVWIAGQGPLLWLYAAQALAKGGRIAGILDMSDPGAWRRAVWRLPCALRKPRYLMLGLSWMRAVTKAVPVHCGRAIRALGTDRLEAIEIDGVRHAADTLLLHDGVVPNTQITRAIQGLRHEWNEAQRAFRPVLDEYGHTSVAGVMVAGDSGGIGGAWAAALSGRIAAIGAACDLGLFGVEQRDALAGPLMLQRGDELAPRGFLDTLYAPLPVPAAADTILCRCEEVTRGTIDNAAQLGCLGVNQLKAFTRAGMGACQGRTCHPLIHAAMAEARHAPAADMEAMRTRFPTKPLTIGELAALAE
ncbi:FAD-dependent oxidoreductase [Rhodovarius crocodyli]|uniref:FAD-dependent oxidoreductase n=1 Tax=Rhodovarius crocodyli TaxID=1979269 RepID=A0A437MEE2_9PROT|nr:NAD(P)/FAD-dependent oxidoreductase [Rhodovarius crocodyli]RVT95975.1 FAD-dependent oxidoreductase [Rhodovarius crocodyli]